MRLGHRGSDTILVKWPNLNMNCKKFFWSVIITYECVVQIIFIMSLCAESYNYDQIVSSNNSLYDDSSSTDMSLSQFYLTC